jgi:hypothetical protein
LGADVFALVSGVQQLRAHGVAVGDRLRLAIPGLPGAAGVVNVLSPVLDCSGRKALGEILCGLCPQNPTRYQSGGGAPGLRTGRFLHPPTFHKVENIKI